MDLVEEIYRLKSFLPKEETFGLSDQMRRAAVSIPSNIAEGQQRDSDKAFESFIAIARGLNAELETQLYICSRLGYLTKEQTETAFSLISEIGKMLNSLMRSINSNQQ